MGALLILLPVSSMNFAFPSFSVGVISEAAAQQEEDADATEQIQQDIEDEVDVELGEVIELERIPAELVVEIQEVFEIERIPEPFQRGLPPILLDPDFEPPEPEPRGPTADEICDNDIDDDLDGETDEAPCVLIFE